jgi:hypothetical protein
MREPEGLPDARCRRCSCRRMSKCCAGSGGTTPRTPRRCGLCWLGGTTLALASSGGRAPRIPPRRYAVALACCPAARVASMCMGMPVSHGKQARVVSWVQSSRSGASGWRRRSTASCCARRAFSAGTRSNGAAVGLPIACRAAGGDADLAMRAATLPGTGADQAVRVPADWRGR